MITDEKSISVLIPNYDWDVTELIKEIHRQLTDAQIPFEILCFDDSKKSEFHKGNDNLNQLTNVTYRVNESSFSRAKNRNELGNSAKYNYLLFLDGDAGLEENHHFIENYLKHVNDQVIICGGTAYHSSIPSDSSFQLRYAYGKSREELPTSIREKDPWAGFSAFNFLIPRKIFLKIKFNEALSEYGHEDTLFGNDLKYNCVPILHINNPALHLGLDSSSVFLEKTRKGVTNLRGMIDAGLVDEDLKLYAWYSRARKTLLTPVLGQLYNKLHKRWEKQLCGPNPSLKLFDLYKLAYLCSLPDLHKIPPKRKI